MRADLLLRAGELARTGQAFVVALVVRREPASSAQVGNMAVITEDGNFLGWLGGSCIRPTVIREALAALKDAAPRLISLTPDPDASPRPGVTVFPMTCHSGGSVDIYVEPVLPPPRVLVFGVSPAAQALARLAKAMGYSVDAIDPEADAATFPEADRVFAELPPRDSSGSAGPRSRVFAVIATQGERDEEALWSALAHEPGYVGVVASRRRFSEIRDALRARGASPAALSEIRNPAGIDIGAKAPAEVALSILAEMVQLRRAQPAAQASSTPEPAAPREARDPVCGMMVDPATARHRAEHAGATYYFCCGGCRARFVAEPERYRATVTS